MRRVKFSFKVILISSLIAVLVASNIIIAILFTSFFKDLTIENIQKSQISNTVKLVDIVSLQLHVQSQMARSMAENERIREMVHNKPKDLLEQLRDNRGVGRILLDYSGSLESIYAVNIFSKNYSEPYSTIMEESYSAAARYRINDYDVFERFVSGNILYKFMNDVYFSISTDKSLGVPMLTVIRWFNDTEGNQVGVLTILQRFDHIFSSLENMKSNKSSDIYIVDDAGTIVYNADYSKLSKNFLLFDPNDMFEKKKNGNVIATIENQEYIITFSRFERIGWTAMEITPYTDLMSSFNTVINKIFTYISTTALIMIAIAILLSNTITSGLRKLLNNIKAIRGGNLESSIKPSRIAEVDDLNVNFLEMMDRINALLRDIGDAGVKERNAELKALQAQINPHFLYNALDAVYWMSDDERISGIINNLGKFFRLSLSKGMEIVPVSLEIEHVRKYVEIQLMIYHDSFMYEEDIDEAVYQYQIIKLVLQPLVENSIMHGFRNRKDAGLVRLIARKESGRIIFIVEDNGDGADLQTMKTILTSSEDTSSYGIKNVNERIKLKYGEGYGLEYRTPETGGTAAVIILPCVD